MNPNWYLEMYNQMLITKQSQNYKINKLKLQDTILNRKRLHNFYLVEY
jgi:hypothetical protein